MDLSKKAKELAAEAASNVSGAAHAAADVAVDQAGHLAHAASGVAHTAGEKVAHVVHATGEKLVYAKDVVVDAGAKVTDKAKDVIGH